MDRFVKCAPLFSCICCEYALEDLDFPTSPLRADPVFLKKLDEHSLDCFIHAKVSRFIEHLGEHGQDNLHAKIVSSVEKAMFSEVLSHVGNNQTKASKILGINRNTLRKKIQQYNLCH